MPDPTFTHPELLDRARSFGVRRWAMAGALDGAPSPLTLQQAVDRLAGFLGRAVTAPAGPSPSPQPDPRTVLLGQLDDIEADETLKYDTAKRAFVNTSFPAGSGGGRSGGQLGRGELVRDGAWTWFVDPRAVYHDGQHRRLYVGAVTATGDDVLASYDLDTGDVEQFTLHAALQVDDHNNPSVLVLPSGRLLAFYCQHAVNGQPVLMRRSTGSEDVTAWGAEQQITANVSGSAGVSYPKPVRLSTGRIYLFFRGANYAQLYTFSDDDGQTWAAAQTLFANGSERPYFHVAQAGDTIHFVTTDGHPRNVPGNQLYHFKLEGGQLKRSDGTVIGPLGSAIGPAQATRVYDDATSGKAWGWDLAVDAQGRPYVAYAAFVSDIDHRYRAARWTGSAWRDAEVCPGGGDIHPGLAYGGGDGEPNYSGGIALDPDDPDTVVLARQVVAAGWDLERWESDDDGLTWRFAAQLTTDGAILKNVRPYRPRGLPAELARTWLWLRGAYDTYIAYATGVMIGPPVRVASRQQHSDVVAPGTVFHADDLNASDGIALTAHPPDTGSSYGQIGTFGIPTITANRVRATGTGDNRARASSAAPTADYKVEADLTVLTMSGHVGVVARDNQSGGSAGYWARYNASGATWQLYRVVNDVATLLGSWPEALAAGDTRRLELRVQGTSVKLLVAGTERIAATDTQVTQAGRIGVRMLGPGNPAQGFALDNLTATVV